MAEAKPMSTAESNAAAMKRMDESKPVPTQEDLDKHVSERAGGKKTDEQRKAEEADKKARAEDVAEANKRMNETTPTPTQDELDQFVVDVGKRQGAERSDEQKKAGEKEKEERAKSNAEAEKRMAGSQPTPTQAEVDAHVVATMSGQPAQPAEPKKALEPASAGAGYQTRAARPGPPEHKEGQ